MGSNRNTATGDDRGRRLSTAVVVSIAALSVLGGAVWWAAHATAARPTTTTAAAAAAVPSEPTPAPAVYVADFTADSRPAEFSAGRVTLTRTGGRPMLGRFGERPITFSLDNLPPHELIHITIDLALLNSWNGSSAYWGPDVWTCGEVDGRPLFSATFCNCGFFSNNNEQSFPDAFPPPPGTEPHPAWTGAAERQSLGEMRHFTNANPEVDEDCSSVYHLDWTFPHDRPDLNLRFASNVKDKAMVWGLLGLRAEAVAHSAPLTPKELQAAWADLGSNDPVQGNAAVWRLAAAGGVAADFVRDQVSRPPPVQAPDDSPYRQGRIDHLLQVIGTPTTGGGL